MSTVTNIYILVLVSSLFILSSCGGSSSGDERSSNTENIPGDVLNPSVSGRFFFESGDSAYVKDLQTGINTLIPHTDWENQNDLYPLGIASFYAQASMYDGVEFLVQVDSCKRNGPDVLDTEITCFSIQDYNGNYTGGFDLLNQVLGFAKLSRDRQYVALFRGLSDDWLAIYSRDGEFISNNKIDSASFDWLPDGRIVYGQGNQFVFTDPYSTLQVNTLTLSSSLEGSLTNLSVSPDGSRIAFSMFLSGNFAAVQSIPYVMDLDGMNIRQLAMRPGGSSPIMGAPVWSPDGGSIFLTAGGASGQDPNAPGVLGYGYVIPSSSNKVMVLSSDDGEKSPEVIRLKHYLLGQAGNVVTERFSNYSYSWQP